MTDDKVKDFVFKHFGEFFKSTKERLHYNFCEEQNIRKDAELLYIFLTIPDEVEKYVQMMQSNSSDNCLIVLMCKKKIKRIFKWVEKFKVQAVLVSEYKKRNHGKIFHSSAKLIASDSDIDEAFKCMH